MSRLLIISSWIHYLFDLNPKILSRIDDPKVISKIESVLYFDFSHLGNIIISSDYSDEFLFFKFSILFVIYRFVSKVSDNKSRYISPVRNRMKLFYKFSSVIPLPSFYCIKSRSISSSSSSKIIDGFASSFNFETDDSSIFQFFKIIKKAHIIQLLARDWQKD